MENGGKEEEGKGRGESQTKSLALLRTALIVFHLKFCLRLRFVALISSGHDLQ